MTQPTSSGPFSQQDHADLAPRSLASADLLVPLVLQLTHAQSVVDVGCGTGAWLAAFRQQGVTDLHGLDGADARNLLLIPAEHFTVADVSALQPPDRTYDLALSLEVAEHLPHEAGPQLVRYLTQAAPQVLFSAAVPGQGGVGHINERWLSYWAGLFKQHGYVPLDALRPQIWHRSEIAWWYRQNLMLFIRQDRLPATYVPPTMVDVVQPELVTRLQHQLHESQHRYISGKEALGHLLASAARRIGFR